MDFIKERDKIETKLLQGDCLELMKNIEDKSVDLILADLPYSNKTTHNDWDNLIPFESLWSEYKRVIKDNGAIVLFGQGKFSAQLIESQEKLYRYTLIWNKVRATGFLNANRMPLRQHEDILVFYKKLPTYNPQMVEGDEPSHSRGSKWASKGTSMDNDKIYGSYKHENYTASAKTNMKYPTSILTFKNVVNNVKRYHPTQKPVDLLGYLIKTYTNENDVVLDNCMGSGSTGVACVNTDRDFIGMELDKNYFNIATERIEKAESGLQDT